MMLRSMVLCPSWQLSRLSRRVAKSFYKILGRSFGICQCVEFAGEFQPDITFRYDDLFGGLVVLGFAFTAVAQSFHSCRAWRPDPRWRLSVFGDTKGYHVRGRPDPICSKLEACAMSDTVPSIRSAPRSVLKLDPWNPHECHGSNLRTATWMRTSAAVCRGSQEQDHSPRC
jgi:hypothetical protein